MDQIATIIGYAVLISGGIGFTMFLCYLPVNYAWKRFGDIRALSSVIVEAKKQGRTIFPQTRNQ